MLGPLCLGFSGSPVAAAPRDLSPSDRAELSDACVIAYWTYNNANFAGKPSLKVRLYGWSGTLGFLLDDVVLGKSCISPTPTATPSAAITDTPVPSATSTETPTPSATPADTATPLATATETLTPTVSPTAGSARMVFLPAAIR